MKKPGNMMTFILIIAFIVTFSVIPTPASGPDIEISSYSVPNRNIYPGEQFTLTMTILNSSGEGISDLFMELADSSFYIRDQGSQVSISDVLPAGDDVENFTVNLVYAGGGNGKIPIKFKYSKGGNPLEISHYLGVRVAEAEVQPEPDTGSYVPVLKVRNKEVAELEAGKTESLKLQIQNMSSYTASNIVVSATPSDALSFPGGHNFYLDSLGSNSMRTVTLNCYLNPDAQAGMHKFTLEYQFTNEYGKSFSSSEVVYIRVGKGNNPPRLVFTPKFNEGQQLSAGEAFNLIISVVNSGKLPARDIRVSLEGLSNEGISLNYGSNRKYIESLAAGEERFINYVVQPSNSIKKGSHPLTLKVAYLDQAGSEISDQQDVFVPVDSSNRGGKGVPKIIISSYESYPVIVQAGQNFNLNIAFLNTHSGKTVQNIKVILTITEGSNETGSVFTPVNSSNTFYIDSIPPRETVYKSLQMYTIPDAQPKTYSITAQMEYEDTDGNEHKASEIIGIPVVQNSKLDVGNIDLPPEVMAGQPFPLSCEFYNTGRTKIRNLLVKVEGDFDKENSMVFIGNLEPGSSEYFDATIIPVNPGQSTGAVVLSYEDPNGEQVETRKDFTFKVIEQPPMEPFPEGPIEPPRTGISGKKWLLLIPVLAVIGAGVWFVRRRKKKKAEEMVFDD